jgi:hypothetical protein
MRISRLTPAAVAFATIAAAALGISPARAAEPQPQRVTIVFTADVSGYLEPCG